MARKLVAVHFMHEGEQAAAEAAVEKVESGDAFVVGRAEDAAIDGLRKQGIVVEELADVPEAQPPEAAAPLGAQRPGALRAGAGTGPQRLRVTLDGPMLQGWRQQLEAMKGQLVRRVKPGEYVVSVDAADVDALAGLPFVAAVEPMNRPRARVASRGIAPVQSPPAIGAEVEADTGAPGGAPAAAGPAAPFKADILVAEGASPEPLKGWLEARGDRVLEAAGRKLRVELAEGAEGLDELRAQAAVEHAEEYLPRKKFNDAARRLLGVEDGQGTRLVPYTGDGELVAVADTGVDDTHPDLATQIAGASPLGRPPRDGQPGRTDDPDGHGTHVAGSIAATGAASGGKWAGVAPGARLYVQSLLDDGGGLGGLPLELSTLFEEAWQKGARIHNDSWGSDAEARYTVDSLEVDEFVARRRDMLVVIAAGNAGVASTPKYRPAGTVDLESMGAPATAKNALVVGASRSDRTAGGYATRTYSACWSSQFPSADGVGNDTVSGDPEKLAAFSSRGFYFERRTKPDVVAPGTDVLSTRSRLAKLSEFWAPAETSDDYAYMGGTSMATPLVSGCAALVREYFRKKEGHQPSAALLKATIVNGTRWLHGADAIVDRDAPPNNDQGFGRVHLPATIPNPSEPWLGLAFLDSWQTPPLQFTDPNRRFRFQIDVEAGHPLRICLAFTDAPAPGLQNDLNLTVEDPGGKKWLGNGAVTAIGYAVPDRSNNVEIVRIDAPAAGRYRVQIASWIITKAPQDFALVVTGALGSKLVKI